MPKIAAMRETFGRILDYGGVAGVEGEIATVADVFALLQAYKQDPADGLYGLHMTNRTVAWYEANAEVLAPQYESLPPQRTLAWLGHLLPPAPAVVLDVGAGTGRDAAFLAASGYDVLALEPAASMRAVGARLHNHARLRWLPDTLPSLAAVSRSGLSADMILLSAVWQHVAPADRASAFRKLVTLRYGGHAPRRGR